MSFPAAPQGLKDDMLGARLAAETITSPPATPVHTTPWQQATVPAFLARL
jgi:hypothetical protein